MDYEKKYKEIISLAKSYKGNNLKEFLDLAFPELTESKDDRIRKRLIKYFKFYQSNPDLTLDVNTWQREKVSDILAYLEKQQPVEWNEEDEKHKQAIIDAILDGDVAADSCYYYIRVFESDTLVEHLRVPRFNAKHTLDVSAYKSPVKITIKNK